MRLTELQRQRSYTGHLEQRLYNLNRIQEEMATGRSLFKPSENVQDADRSLTAQQSLASDAQFLRNIDDGKNWTSHADAKLQQIVECLNRIDALAVAADNSSQTAEDRNNTAIQMDQELETLMGLVNATDGNRYLFGGTGTSAIPFAATRDASGRISGAATNQDTIAGKVYRRLSEGEDVQINVPGSTLFQPLGQSGTDSDIFYVVASLRDTVANNNTPPAGSESTLSNEHLRSALSDIRERITEQQTYLGSVAQRLDQTKARLKDRQITLTDEVEQAQGVEMTDLVSRLAVEQGGYDALATLGTKLLKQTLIDYIR